MNHPTKITQVTPEPVDAIGAIELDDALLDAEVRGAGPDDVLPNTTTAGWVCNPAICCP